MESFYGAIVGGLKWIYCSAQCMQRCTIDAAREMKNQVERCPRCKQQNAELLAVLDGAEPRQARPNETFVVTPQAQHDESASVPFNPLGNSTMTTGLERSINGLMTVDDRGCPCPRIKPGKVTNNTFLNFVREHRRMNCGKKTQPQLVQDAAALWRNMSEQQKANYTKKMVRQRNATTRQ